jgi:hypothetical protein
MVLSRPTGRKGFNLDNIVPNWIKAGEGAAMFSIVGTDGSFTLPNLLQKMYSGYFYFTSKLQA